jgi:PPP family 3-phenylpropionic acid transporter
LIEALTLGHLDRQAERYGGIRLWGSIGFVVAVLGVGMTLDHVAEHVVLWASASFLLGMAVTSFFMTESPIPASGAAFGRLRDVVISPPVRSFLAASFFMSAAHGALYVFYSLYLVSEGYSKTQVGALWTLGVIAEILVFAFMPQLFRRFSIKAVLLFCFACAGLRFALIGFGVGSPVLLVLAQLMHGATFGAHHASAMAVIHRWFGPGQHARGQALYGSLSFGAGGMMGALLSGAVWETLGPALCFSLASAFGWAGWLIISRTHFEEPQHGR